ncbi:hypothetical protein [Streptomyces sp. NPDC088726]|uniref:hypothetical protein n=1 Tax=Streptomyces sp. NPDC088726 TaxID=3365874 RepID=UPI00381537FD
MITTWEITPPAVPFGQPVLQGAAEVVLVADQRPPGPGVGQFRFDGEQVEQVEQVE